MKIAIDVMGGDNAPLEIVKGAVEAADEYLIDIYLVGKSEEIEKILDAKAFNNPRIHIVNATEIIENEDSPTIAIRTKKDSSMVVGMKMLKNGEIDAFVSAGNTGALLAGGLFVVGRIKGIDRPALAPILPGRCGPVMLVDAGANAECKVRNITQFAMMGEIYFKNVMKYEFPRVGLINIGVEEEKGTEFTKECYKALKESNKSFVGNIEGRDILEGKVQVVVADGFTGNVVLKVFEGTAMTILKELKIELMRSFITKIGAFLSKGAFTLFKKKFDYTEHGGAILIGLNGPVIKAHGSSNAKAIKNAIRQAIKCVDGKIIESIKNELEEN
ncbi:phosphate acyltransferase PlsX [Clostridium cylindrosporum]|uniref:Phosphate acyltransferase n=1 Tax=Clostridium cylindrosporum DSM 605 TaxID=1121307 RepID=A0A0J8G133_CLOCY|nr:phosphate acyltransferase PlsX [Clostridium cylindrosporum]KMT21476.1 phosphate acyltransferase PlsX [Clostridium cylindrosporum DSM 605]